MKGTQTMTTQDKPTTEVLSTPLGVLSFLAVDKPKTDDNGNTRFQTTLIMDPAKMTAKDKERFAAMKAAAKKALKDKFGADAFDSNGNPKSTYKWPFRDAADMSKHKGFEAGKIFIRCSSERKPSLGKYVIENGAVRVIDVDDTSIFYAGATAQLKVNVYAYEAKGNKGVAFGLRSIAQVRDGERLDGGSQDASEAFADGAGLAADELGFEEAAKGGGESLF